MKHAIRWVDISVSDTEWRAHSRAAARAMVEEVEHVGGPPPQGEGGTVEDDAVPASAGTCGPHDMAEFKKCFSQTTGLGPP